MSNISMRHVPNISDSMSPAPDFSDSSFQIPAGANATVDLLMAQDGGDFFQGIDQTLNTPAVARFQRTVAPLTFAEMTPNSRRERSVPVRSSLRLRQRIATPKKPVVSRDLAAALHKAVPGTRSDSSFEIPLSQTGSNDLIMVDNGGDFLQPGEVDLLASPLSPVQDTRSLSQFELRHSSTSVPSVLHAVGREPITIGLPSPSSEKPEFNKPFTTEDQQPSSEVVNEETAALPSESNITFHQLKADEDSSPIQQQQQQQQERENAPNAPRTRASSKKFAANILDGSVPGVKSKRAAVDVDSGTSKTGKAKLPKPKHTRGLSITKKSIVEQRPPSVSMEGSDILPASAAVTQQSVPNFKEAISECEPGNLAEAPTSSGHELEQVLTGSERLGRHIHEDQNFESPPVGSNPRRVDEGRSTPDPSRNRPLTLRADPESDHETPLTVPQVSPCKEDTAPKDTLNTSQGHAIDLEPPLGDALITGRPPSPMRTSTKRPSSSAVSEPGLMGSKPNKRARGAMEQERPSSNVTSTRILRSSRARNALASAFGTSSRPHPVNNRRTVADPSVKKLRDARKSRASASVATLSVRQKENKQFAQLTDSALPPSSLRTSSRSKDVHPQRENAPEFEGAARRLAQTLPHGQMRKLKSSTQELVTSDPPANATRPIGFHFQTDMRIETRRTELGKSDSSSMERSRSQHPVAIPDFKSIHAAHESLLTSRRGHNTFIVPTEFTFRTETRAHEREKFEEERRKREKELEAQMEERRRLRELEEEKEIRELRKRAVPKANEVPEWYAHAPKKAEKTKTA